MSEDRIVVVGGTGFLGRQICKDLVAAGRDVLVVARNAARSAPGYRFRAIDVSDTPTGELAAMLAAERPDTVINATGGKWGLTGRELEASCVGATRHILAALASARLAPRLVHLGSVLEYGHVAPDGTDATQRSPGPASDYDRFKLAATEAVLSAAAAGTVDAVVLRLANVAGPGAPAASLLGRVADRLAAAAGRGETAMIELTALNARRDYVDVRDVSDAVRAATRITGRPTPIAIGRGEAVPVRTLVTMLIEVSGVPATMVEIPAPDLAADTDDWTRVDPQPARDLLGWTPRRTLRDSVHELWHDVMERTASQPSRSGGSA
ncbi:NAD-dependent epimerase/dehydratase family protein [Nonomuraea purpurea]|uniref:NAD-dependent epimerase/dehydratase family protein n=1 Tax=Nonomuraea purpurea TaxID=1849276 RepID=A0ABV8GIE8_9ACTN